jgi:hypothetical protein
LNAGTTRRIAGSENEDNGWGEVCQSGVWRRCAAGQEKADSIRNRPA